MGRGWGGEGQLTWVSGEVEQQHVAAEAAQVVQRLQVLLQLPAGEFTPEDGRQVPEDVGVQRRRPADRREGTGEGGGVAAGHAPSRVCRNLRVPEEELVGAESLGQQVHALGSVPVQLRDETGS